MIDRIREVKLAGLCLGLTGLYGAGVSLAAATVGQPALLDPVGMRSVYTLWAVALAFIAVMYLTDLVLIRRPARPLAALAADARADLLRGDWFIARATVIGTLTLLFAFFSPAKIMIPELAGGFHHDILFADIDRALFLGHDPWRLTHALLPWPWVSLALQSLYNMWFFLMWFSAIYLVVRPGDFAVRARYILAFPLTWITAGTVSAVFLSAAGPCFFAEVTGSDRFAPLLAKLAADDAALAAHGLGISSLDLQVALWRTHEAGASVLGGGVSAMPSLHVASAVLLALACAGVNRRLAAVMWANAALIWLGSVHLAWHYAIDGVLGGAIALAAWKTADIAISRFARPTLAVRLPSAVSVAI